jgi:hypothetical protein
MMRRVLLILGVLGTLGLMAAAAAGYGVLGGPDPQMHAHALLSLAATLVLMFSHTWIVLYLLATGRVMADTVRTRGLDAALLERARRMRLGALPWLLAAVGALIVTFLLGSAAFSGRILGWLHQGFFYLALVLQIVAITKEGRVLAAHDQLSIEVARHLEADAA